ncbi:MAG: hypothetical protein WC444_06760 [Candidatus Paceibacterota bacterium]
MGNTTKITIGFLILTILSVSIYIMLPEGAKIVVSDTNTKLYVWEDSSWELGATETVKLYNGSKLMTAKSRSHGYENISETEFHLIRNVTYASNITVQQTYVFNPMLDKVDFVSLSSIIRCLNCKGKILQVEYSNLEGFTEATRDAISPENFGHNIRIIWQNGAYYAKVRQLVGEDKLTIKYKPIINDEIFNIEMNNPQKKIIKNCIGVTTYYNETIPQYEHIIVNKSTDNGSIIEDELIYLGDEIKIISSIKQNCSEILTVNNKTVDFKKQGYMCSENHDGVICDSCIDGNCDGACSSSGGETCCKIFDEQIICKNGIIEWINKSYILPVHKLEVQQ